MSNTNNNQDNNICDSQETINLNHNKNNLKNKLFGSKMNDKKNNQVRYHKNPVKKDDIHNNLDDDVVVLNAVNEDLKVLKRKREGDGDGDVNSKQSVKNKLPSGLKSRINKLSLESKLELMERFQSKNLIVRKCLDKMLQKICFYIDTGKDDVKTMCQENFVEIDN